MSKKCTTVAPTGVVTRRTIQIMFLFRKHVTKDVNKQARDEKSIIKVKTIVINIDFRNCVTFSVEKRVGKETGVGGWEK